MSSAAPVAKACPRSADQRKSAQKVGRGSVPAAVPVRGYAAVREALRAPAGRQAGFKAELVTGFAGATRAPILYLAGEAHRRQRAATARFFAPRAVMERHRPLMERTADRLVADFVRHGSGLLDAMALDLAVTVAGEIIGLTESDKAGMMQRLDAFFSFDRDMATSGLPGLLSFLRGQLRMLNFHFRDVRPAIRARRHAPREDVISHLIGEGYSNREILVECFTYGAAGMVTTREFVTMAGWHLLEDDRLRSRFVAAEREERIAILEEILRLEPVVGTLYRRSHGEEPPLALDIRSANGDSEIFGACPHRIDPDRARPARVGGAGLAFGDGEHRCPGAAVALNEAEVFLGRLLQLPGIRLEKAPDMDWNPLVTGYELRGCRVAIGEAQ